jgi:hypothetical protein
MFVGVFCGGGAFPGSACFDIDVVTSHHVDINVGMGVWDSAAPFELPDLKTCFQKWSAVQRSRSD